MYPNLKSLISITPELARVGEARIRKQIERRTTCSKRAQWVLAPILGGLMLLLIMAITPMLAGIRDFGAAMGYNRAVAIVAGCSVGLLLVMLTGLILTPLVGRLVLRKESWKQLNNAGFPTCIRCGYDLSGRSGNRCPECASVTVPMPSDGDGRANFAAAVIRTTLWVILGVVLGWFLGQKITSYFGL